MKTVSDLATQIAAQIWCTHDTETIEMDVRLADEFAIVLDAWIETGAMYSRNSDFYMDLLDQCAEHLGAEAYTADDGGIHDSPIRMKIPELVKQLTNPDDRGE